MREVTFLSILVFIMFQVAYITIPLITRKRKDFSENVDEKGMSILIPAYNESVVIKNCINASMKVRYSNKEIIVINDGSKDNTMDVLKEFLNLEIISRSKANVLKHNNIKNIYRSTKYESVIVIDKENGGKADALNAGIEYASKELIITLDADSMLKSDSLYYINQYFQDDNIVAAGGTVHVVQGFEGSGDDIRPRFKGNGLIKHQILHYIHGFYVKKLTQSELDSIVVIAGAFGTFKRDILLKVNGFRKSVGEDMDITMKIHKYIHENKLEKKLVYIPEAVSYTECPEDMSNFYSQRIRWQKAFIDCAVQYWGSFFNKFNVYLSIFTVIDGFLFGTIAAFTTLVTPALLGFSYKAMGVMIILMLFVSVFDFLQNAVALIVAAKYGIKYTFIEYINIFLYMLWERVTYKLFPLYLNTIGTIKYFIEGDKWSSIERKGEVSIA